MSRRACLWGAVALLWVAFLIRAHQIEALPPFNDESLHIRRAEQVWTFQNPDVSFTVGKLLAYYWYGIFHPARLDAIFVTRTVTGLFALMGLAASAGIGRRLFGGSAGMLALLMLAFAPYMIFFDRLALTDPITTAIGMITVWASLRMLDYPRKLWAGMAVGLLCTLTILAKLIGLPFAGIPVLAVAILGSGTLGQRWEAYRRPLLACYLTVAGLLTPFFLRVVYKELTGNRISVVDTHLINTQTPLETLQTNIGQLFEALTVFNHPLFMGLALLMSVAGLWFRPRPAVFLLAGLLAVWGFSLATGGALSERYLQLGVPFFFLLVAGGMVRFRLAWGGVALWIGLFCLPFIVHSWNDPRLNIYPARARWEYFTNFSAGYGLVDAAEVLPQLPPSDDGRIPVLGLVGSCHQIRLYLDETGNVDLTCLEFGWMGGELMEQVADTIDQRVAEESNLYLLVEPEFDNTPLEMLRVRHEVIATWQRPFDGMRVELWRVDAEEPPHS